MDRPLGTSNNCVSLSLPTSTISPTSTLTISPSSSLSSSCHDQTNSPLYKAAPMHNSHERDVTSNTASTHNSTIPVEASNQGLDSYMFQFIGIPPYPHVGSSSNSAEVPPPYSSARQMEQGHNFIPDHTYMPFPIPFSMSTTSSCMHYPIHTSAPLYNTPWKTSINSDTTFNSLTVPKVTVKATEIAATGPVSTAKCTPDGRLSYKTAHIAVTRPLTSAHPSATGIKSITSTVNKTMLSINPTIKMDVNMKNKPTLPDCTFWAGVLLIDPDSGLQVWNGVYIPVPHPSNTTTTIINNNSNNNSSSSNCITPSVHIQLSSSQTTFELVIIPNYNTNTVTSTLLPPQATIFSGPKSEPATISTGPKSEPATISSGPKSGTVTGKYTILTAMNQLVTQYDNRFVLYFHPCYENILQYNNAVVRYTVTGNGSTNGIEFIIHGKYSVISSVLEIYRYYLST